MASSDQSQYEKELGTTVEQDLAAILGSQVKDEAPQTPKRKEPPAATASVQAESINSSAPQTISSTDLDEDHLVGSTVCEALDPPLFVLLQNLFSVSFNVPEESI